jgi:hypothetical protein
MKYTIEKLADLGGCPRIKKLDRTDQPTNLQKKDAGFYFG